VRIMEQTTGLILKLPKAVAKAGPDIKEVDYDTSSDAASELDSEDEYEPNNDAFEFQRGLIWVDLIVEDSDSQTEDGLDLARYARVLLDWPEPRGRH
jgi:hypothetical protein